MTNSVWRSGHLGPIFSLLPSSSSADVGICLLALLFSDSVAYVTLGPLVQSSSHPLPPQAISFKSEEEPGMLGDMPFMALETRNSRTGNRLRMTSDEALEVMFGLRAELEVRLRVGQREA